MKMFASGSPTTSGTEGGSGAGSGGANRSVDYSTTSDDQILDLDDDGSDGAGDEGGEDGAGDGGQADDDTETVELTDEGDEGEATDEEDEQRQNQGDEEDEEGGDGQDEDEEDATGEEQADKDLAPKDTANDPAHLKELFKKNPELRTAYYAEKAYREVIPTVAEARQYKEAFPTVDDVKAAQESVEQMQAFDDKFFSNDPKDSAEFLAALHEADQDAFARVATVFPAALYQLNKDLYREKVFEPITRSFLARVLENGKQLGDPKRFENLQRAIDVISMHAFKVPFKDLQQQGNARREPDPRDREIERLRSQVGEQGTVKFQQFHSQTNDLAVNRVVKLIEKGLTDPDKGVLKGTAFAKSEFHQKKIVGEIYSQIDAALKADRALVSQLRTAFRSAQKNGKFSQDESLAVAKMFSSRAYKLFPKIASKVVGEWTKAAVGGNTQRLKDRQRNNARVDITGATGGAGTPRKIPASKLKPEAIDYRRTSDDDIMSGKVRVKKAK